MVSGILLRARHQHSSLPDICRTHCARKKAGVVFVMVTKDLADLELAKEQVEAAASDFKKKSEESDAVKDKSIKDLQNLFTAAIKAREDQKETVKYSITSA